MSAELHGGLVKNDLDWVAENWASSGCDLWEELTSNDFFWNRYVDRASLHMGAQFADQVGDADAAAKYRAASKQIEQTLMAHYDGGFVLCVERRL